jgi:hypothetical protein
LKLSPDNRLNGTLPDKTAQCFRWVNDLDYEDDEGHRHKLNALPPNICFTDLHKGGAPLPSDHGEQAL